MKKEKIKKEKIKFNLGYLLFAIMLWALGVLLIAFRETPKNLALAFSIILILFSAYRLVDALSKEERSYRFTLRLVVAFAVLVGGVANVVFREKVAELLIALFALAIIIDGSFKLQLTVKLKTYTLPLFWVMLSLSVLVIAGGFIAIKFPMSSAENNSVFIGIVFIINGISNFFSPFGMLSCEKKARELSEEKETKEPEQSKE